MAGHVGGGGVSALTYALCRPLRDGLDDLVPDLKDKWAKHAVLTALGPVRSEVVILRAAHRMVCPYEWAHHVSRARMLGMSDTRIAALQGEPKGENEVIVRAVDALFDEKRMSLVLEAELVASIGRTGVFHLTATVGFYSVLGYMLMTYETPIDETIADEMAERQLTSTT